MAAEVAAFREMRLWPIEEFGEDQYSMRDDSAAFWRNSPVFSIASQFSC
jgi:hypothetical protein